MLERAGVDIGIVTGIIGSASFSVVFEGEARHAGTTPMDARRDAALGAAAFVLGVRETVTTGFPGCVATIGDIATEPGSYNVVPGRPGCAWNAGLWTARSRTRSSGRSRSERAQRRSGSASTSRSSGSGAGSRRPPTSGSRLRSSTPPQTLELSALRMPSGAGHDAQALAAITPSGMVFVPSVGGISHDPSEHTRWEDCVNGANVLLNATVELALAGG